MNVLIVLRTLHTKLIYKIGTVGNIVNIGKILIPPNGNGNQHYEAFCIHSKYLRKYQPH